MRMLVKLAASAALAAGLAATSMALAADPPFGHGGGAGQQVHGGGMAPQGHGAGGMPPRGFRGAPPSFSGALPRGAGPAGGQHYAIGRRGQDLGAFNGRSYGRFTPQDRSSWQGGGWRHSYHNGYLGWWWVVGNDWFYYPSPIYPYPEYVGPDYYYDYYNYYPTPSYYWYYCEDPPGYYPNVQDCNGPWEPVPPAD